MKHFDTETAANCYANSRRNGDEVYGLNGSYIVCTPEEADELHAAGVPLTIASPDDGDLDDEGLPSFPRLDDIIDESMDGDHASALESVYGPDDDGCRDIDDMGFGGDFFDDGGW